MRCLIKKMFFKYLSVKKEKNNVFFFFLKKTGFSDSGNYFFSQTKEWIFNHKFSNPFIFYQPIQCLSLINPYSVVDLRYVKL